MKKLVAAAVPMAVVAAGGIAWAVLGGTLVVPDIAQGFISGQGNVSCQTGGVTLTLPDPTWSNSLGDYAVSTLDYSSISTQCVNLGTADLVVTITAPNGTTPLATATATDIGSASGQMNLSQALAYDTASDADYNYLVKDN